MSEIIDIVDENDEIIGQNTRHESYRTLSRNRIVFVVLLHGESIYLQRRSASCSFCPWALDITAGGHVSHSQTYKEAAYRELFEEVWVEWIDLRFHSKTKWDRFEIDKKYQPNKELIRGKSHEFFREVYECEYDGKFTFDDWEVEEVMLFSKKELHKMIENKEYMTPSCVDILTKYYLDN